MKKRIEDKIKEIIRLGKRKKRGRKKRGKDGKLKIELVGENEGKVRSKEYI